MMETQLFRYFCVGGIAFVVDAFTLYCATDILKLHYLWGASAGFIAGLTINYLLSISWVFKHRTCNCQQTEFIIFAAVGLVGLACNDFFMWFFTNLVGFYPVIAKCFTAVIVFFWNYYGRKILLFHDVKVQETVSIKHEEG